MLKPLTLAACLIAPAASADITLRFDEGAPKDRFTVTNVGGCALPAGVVTIDLGTAPAGLIFDVTRSGAGVEVFQPFELVAGKENLQEAPQVLDGDTAISLAMTGLGAGQSIVFTIDVDDTSGGREITVSGSEIAGATLKARFGTQKTSALVDETAEARAPLAACLS